MLIVKQPRLSQPIDELALDLSLGPVLGCWVPRADVGTRNVARLNSDGDKGGAVVSIGPFGKIVSATDTLYAVKNQTLEGTGKYWSSGTGVQRTLVAFAKPNAFSFSAQSSGGSILNSYYGIYRGCGLTFGASAGNGRILWKIDATVTDFNVNSATRLDDPTLWPYGLVALVIDGTSVRAHWMPRGPNSDNFPEETFTGSWSGDVGGETASVGVNTRAGLLSPAEADIVCAAILGYAATYEQLKLMRNTAMGCLFAPQQIYFPTAAAAGGPPTLVSLVASGITTTGATLTVN